MEDLWKPLLPKPCSHNDGRLVDVSMGHPSDLEKVFLAARNPHAQLGRNCGMWRVTEASLFASTLFFTAQIFPKRFLKN